MSQDSEAPVIRRQALSLRTGVCDMRVGAGAIDQTGQNLRMVVGKPRRVLMVSGSDVDAGILQRVERSCVDAGFEIRPCTVAAGRACRSLDEATRLYGELHDHGITADDAIVGVGDADVLSLLAFVASTWCGGCALCGVATTLDGMVDVPVTLRALDAGGAAEMLSARGNIRLLMSDVEGTDLASPTAGTLMGRAVMVAGAVAAGQRSFSDLAVKADEVCAQDAAALAGQILELTKVRCRVASSSAVAIRQGMGYGLELARALGACLDRQGRSDVCEGRLLAEGLRIAARLAAAMDGGQAHVDFVFAQDGLLDKFGLAEVACDIDPDELLATLDATRLERTNRLMLALPLDYGRVRLAAPEPELLRAHLTGWCLARRKLLARISTAQGAS